MSSTDPSADQPQALAGLRVIDLSRHMAAPYASAVLADFGADVIKVESWPKGDPARSIRTAGQTDSDVFMMWNRGKRSISVDLRQPEGRRLVEQLVAGADVFIESYRPGVADNIGLGYEALRSINDRLVYCSVSAFGPTGPLASDPGTDPVVQAVSGVMSVTGEKDGLPVLVGVPMADFSSAMVLVQAVLLGLAARERTGRGQKVDVSMLAAMLFSLTTRLATYWSTGTEPQRHGSAHSVTAPYQAYETSDGHVVAGAWAADAWPRFCAAVDRPDLAGDPRFNDNALRVKNLDEFNEIVRPIFRQRTSAEWQQRFSAERALFGHIMTIPQILEHPQASHLVKTVEHPVAGTIKALGPHIAMSDTPGVVDRPSPTLGQHTREILAELGLDEIEVDGLFERGVVGARQLQPPAPAEAGAMP